MSSSTHSVLCGACKCAVKTVANPKPDDKVTCPGCGREDRFDKVMATVKEHVVYLTKKRLNKAMADAARGSSVLQFKGQQVPNRSFRWTTDLRG